MMAGRTAWQRAAVLVAAAGLTLLLSWNLGGNTGRGEEIAQATTRAPGPAQALALRGEAPADDAKPPPAPAANAPDLPQRERVERSTAKDPFAAHGWVAAPRPPRRVAPPPPAPVPVPAPVAPPIPYRFVGMIEEKSARPAAFLARGEALLVVHVGDVLENTYRIESFGPGEVVVTYLPMQQRERIAFTGE